MSKKRGAEKKNAAPAVEDIFVEEISSSMPAEMADFTKSLIRSGLRQFKIEKDVAQHIKSSAEAKFEGTWHCIVGQNFGCSVCFSAKHLFFARISAAKAKDVALKAE
eukprot:CAMPEP_0195524858 /NCGR_PEP_ID=MMETSP0794_2-20130614/24953_1 /TAXON_ID=515487 /ORGANISM="Stephanopyxis turris, Strain CCMP 815" /LENGTH=106 /DNA_ID=CAMNT_0040655177 /DNA_START=50 /DNA_END=367 /DNA_ORIENTATION=+